LLLGQLHLLQRLQKVFTTQSQFQAFARSLNPVLQTLHLMRRSMALAQVVFQEFPTSPSLAHRQISYSYLWMAKKCHVRRGLPVQQVFIAQAMY
jgi:hypothetical protein